MPNCRKDRASPPLHCRTSSAGETNPAWKSSCASIKHVRTSTSTGCSTVKANGKSAPAVIQAWTCSPQPLENRKTRPKSRPIRFSQGERGSYRGLSAKEIIRREVRYIEKPHPKITGNTYFLRQRHLRGVQAPKNKSPNDKSTCQGVLGRDKGKFVILA